MTDKPSFRHSRVGEEVRAHVAKFLVTEGYAHISITNVEMTTDLSIAKILFRTFEKEEKVRKAAQKILRELTPQLRSIIAKHLNLRRTPNLRFQYDLATERAERLDSIFDQIKKEEPK